MNDYYEFIEKDHLIPVQIEKKEEIYTDLENIKNSWTGRIDASFTNAFIQEAVHLIVNAIVIYEKGYFDCAYYALRQSLEISTTMNYLIELNPEERDMKFNSWKTQKWFPMNKKMLDFMEKNEDMYFDMFKNMKEYFEIIDSTKKKLNKYVHKQGYDYLYITRNHPINSKRDKKKDVIEFLEILKICVGAVAILRLGIDPMPVLLMDEEIYYRTGDTMTSAFSYEFVDKYIGIKYIEQYKQTEVYKNHYNSIIQEEKKTKSVMNVIRNKYVDKRLISEILEQRHLLRKEEIIVVVYCGMSEKIVKAYSHGGLEMYFTNLKTNRTIRTWSGMFFNEIAEKDNPINCEFDEAYISYFKVNDDLDVFVEHNEKFNKDEIQHLKNVNI
jgi:hypothetical protein